MKGDTIAGRFRVEKLLGVAGSGFVVAARHTRLDQRVALKILTSLTTAQGNAVLSVAQRVASVKSAHVARVVDTGHTDEGYPFVATALSEGRTVADLLIERGTLAPSEAIGIVLQACTGLAEAHAAGVVHGNLKPRNLFLTKHGIELLDFGMTQPLESEESSAAWFASPAYLAPEQLRDPSVDARADIWALGVILHELITGKLPFEADTIAGMFVAVAYNEPALVAMPGVPSALETLIHTCLAKNASARPQSVTALARELAPFADVDPSTVTARDNTASLGPELAMAVSLDPEESALESKDFQRDDAVNDGATRMASALTSASSRPPPLPGHRLGATPRAARLRPRVTAYAKGWLATRLPALPSVNPDTRTEMEQSFQRRRWGAIAVVAAACVLGLAGLFATPSSASASAAALDEPEPAALNESSLDFGTSPFVPPTFALPDRGIASPSAPPPPFTALVVPPPAPTPVAFRPAARPRLPVREDPYARPTTRSAMPPVIANGFTHPARLPEKSRARSF